MADPQLPTNVNYIFVPAPLSIDSLRSILRGIESESNTHPVNPSYPTNSWVVHVYSAIDPSNKRGYAILYDIPPVDDDGLHPVQVSFVNGTSEDEKVANAARLVGRGNELIGYEDMSGSQRAVIFRNTQQVVPPAGTPTALSWNTSDHPERGAWTNTLLTLVGAYKDSLEAGNPNGFDSDYAKLAPALKLKFWAELIIAVAKFESNWKPNDIYHERPPLNENSVGLLQLSLSDQHSSLYHLTPKITSEAELQDPLLNLKWGMNIFSTWLAKDRVVAEGADKRSARGAAHYWSVLRAGSKRELIKALTRRNVGL